MAIFRSIALSLGFAAVLCAAARTASADSVVVDGIRIDFPTGAEGTIPSGSATNDIFGTASGWYGATVYRNVSGEVTYTYIGAEAGYVNRFIADGSVRFTHPGTPFGTTYTTTGTTGVPLDFAFQYNSGAGTLANDGFSNPNDEFGAFAQSMFVAYLTTAQYSSYLGRWLDAGLYLCLDDGGAGPDDNHDDMVVRLSAVPEPSSLALLGIGLASLAAAARRRRSARHGA